MEPSIRIHYVKNEYGKFMCPYCDKITTNQNTMHYHITSKHSISKKYSCTECEQQFVQKSTYLWHMAHSHPDCTSSDNPYLGVSVSCPCCSHTTKTKANMLIHYARVHCKEWIPSYNKSVPCPGCNDYFKSASAYLYHALLCLSNPEYYANIVERIN
jgi:hypothetical protein